VKKFRDLREAKDKVVFNKKMSGYPVVITKTDKGFHLTIDGDSVDAFKSQKEAEVTAKQVLKDLGK
jgi:hypothetical protein|tara:strand:+ start:973 stop:1170 length:198 start_codon:yes stop_codon:yes gene_type:complete